MGHHEVEKSRAAVFDPLVLEHDEKIRGHRHDLPGHEEEEGVVGQDHHEHAGEKQVVEDDKARDGPPTEIAAHVPEGVDRDEQGEQPDDDQEKAGQGVEAQGERQVGKPEQQRHRRDRSARDAERAGHGGQQRRRCGEGEGNGDHQTLAAVKKKRQDGQRQQQR